MSDTHNLYMEKSRALVEAAIAASTILTGTPITVDEAFEVILSDIRKKPERQHRLYEILANLPGSLEECWQRYAEAIKEESNA